MTITMNGHLTDIQICEGCGGVSYATRKYLTPVALQEYQCVHHHLMFRPLPQPKPYASVTQFTIAEQSA